MFLVVFYLKKNRICSCFALCAVLDGIFLHPWCKYVYVCQAYYLQHFFAGDMARFLAKLSSKWRWLLL
jgi:hypothetical protein